MQFWSLNHWLCLSTLPRAGWVMMDETLPVHYAFINIRFSKMTSKSTVSLIWNWSLVASNNDVFNGYWNINRSRWFVTFGFASQGRHAYRVCSVSLITCYCIPVFCCVRFSVHKWTCGLFMALLQHMLLEVEVFSFSWYRMSSKEQEYLSCILCGYGSLNKCSQNGTYRQVSR